MKPRVLGILAAATAGVLGVAFLATRAGNQSGPSARDSSSAASGEFLFPQLRAGADAIVELRVSHGDTSARIVRDAGTNTWHVASLGNYPANPDRVRDTVRSMVDSKIVERKTARKESHATIGVDDPGAAGARSILLEAVDAQGKPVARLILGDVAPSAAANFDPSTSARFVRRADEDQSYLVTGRFPADPSPTAWVVRTIVEIPASRVREVRVTPAMGEPLVASRDSATSELTLRDIPTGRSVKDQTQVARLAQALAFLTLEGVKPASDAAALGGFDGVPTFDLLTFDHLLLRAHVAKHAEEFWVRLEALPEPTTAASVQTNDQGTVSAPSANGEISLDDPAPAPAQPAPAADAKDATRDAARAEADALNAKLAPWIFRVAAAKGEQLLTTLNDVLTPAAIQGPEQPPSEVAPPATAPAPIPSIAPPPAEPDSDPAKKLFPDSRP